MIFESVTLMATAEKGKAVLASLVDSFASVLEILQRG
jgi:creatinine amidohydrolase/Fe(II)-dependent formamide hydrolase-like protein